jgi:hypothetical protein
VEKYIDAVDIRLRGEKCVENSTEKPTNYPTRDCNWVTTMDCLILQNEERLKQVQTWELNEEIQVFREYLRIPSVHPNINYSKFTEKAAMSSNPSHFSRAHETHT